ncbi:MAG: prephenate dehydrogenase [Mailhella sp.]|nr:prephenate dehydrogenase [Mailhella sp.]
MERAAMKRVVIAGCRGRMGAMLMRRFGQSQDVQPAGLSRPYGAQDVKEACRGARAVILCVPPEALADTAKKLIPHMEPRTILADITSVKELPMRLMEDLWAGPVVGTHPLFGPRQAEGLELRTAIVQGRRASEEDVDFIEGLFRILGSVTFRATAEEHDIAESRIQGMNFIATAAYFAMAAEDPALLRYVTPSFMRLMNASRKLLMEDGPMFTRMFEANPHSQQMVRSYRNMLGLAAAGDAELILSRARWWWEDGEEKEQLHKDAECIARQSARSAPVK